jgi:hypothetical protein
MEAMEWKHLPKAGGLEDQDELLMENVFRLASAIRRVRQ